MELQGAQASNFFLFVLVSSFERAPEHQEQARLDFLFRWIFLLLMWGGIVEEAAENERQAILFKISFERLKLQRRKQGSWSVLVLPLIDLVVLRLQV